MHACVGVHVHPRMHVCVYVCMHTACVYTCAHVCVYSDLPSQYRNELDPHIFDGATLIGTAPVGLAAPRGVETRDLGTMRIAICGGTFNGQVIIQPDDEGRRVTLEHAIFDSSPHSASRVTPHRNCTNQCLKIESRNP